MSAFLQKLATVELSSEFATAAFLLGELPFGLLTPLFVHVNWGLPADNVVVANLPRPALGLGNLTLIFAYGFGGKGFDRHADGQVSIPWRLSLWRCCCFTSEFRPAKRSGSHWPCLPRRGCAGKVPVAAPVMAQVQPKSC